MTRVTEERVRQATKDAVAEARERSGYGDRLIPFTAAELRFIEDVVAGTVTRLLVDESAD